MRKIYKYPFEIKDKIEIEMPACSMVVHVGLDPQGQPCVWANVEPEAQTIKQIFYVRGTGHDLGDASGHLGSFVQGDFVWHLFQ